MRWIFHKGKKLGLTIPDEEYKKMISVITSSVYLAFSVCLTEGWLMAHRIVPDQHNAYIERGRFIDSISFGRGRHQIKMGFSKIDIVEKGRVPIIVEVKASGKSLKSGIHQVKYLLYVFFRETGVVAVGQVRIPSEKKRYTLRLTQDIINEVETNLKYYFRVVQGPMPEPQYRHICDVCGYVDLCFPE